MSAHPLSRISSTNEQYSPSARSSTLYQALAPQQGNQQSFKIPRKPVPIPLIREDELSGEGRAFSKPYPAKSHYPWYRKLGETIRSWWPELLATFLSVVGLLAIVIVLRVYEGQQIENLNLPRYLTLNGLIAAIATFDRVFLVIPIGSALSQEAWLWFIQNDSQPHCRSRLHDLDRSDAASRGAWGSLLFIFTSPRRYISLFGALVSVLSLAISTFTQQLIVVKTIQLDDPSSSWQPGNVPRTEYYDSYSGNPSQGPLSVPLNMTAAVYNGNCTWPLTPSLAVCGGCAPISPLYTHCNITHCNFTMPSGSIFQLANFSEPPGKGQGFQTMTSYGQHWNKSTGGRLYLANFDMMGAIYNYRAPMSNFDNMMNASECALWMCVNQYNTSVVLGKQYENVRSTFDDTDWQIYGYYVNFTFKYPNTTAGADNGSYTNYTVHPFAASALQSHLSPLLTGTVQLNNNARLASSDVIQAMWAGTVDPDQWIRKVATSMSNIVRPSNYFPRDIYAGTAYVQAITVSWWWLSLPVVTVVGSTLLLLIVMTKTAMNSVKPWRGNPLTLLFMEVDLEIRRMAAIVNAEDGSESELGEQKVTLRRLADGVWRLKSHQT